MLRGGTESIKLSQNQWILTNDILNNCNIYHPPLLKKEQFQSVCSQVRPQNIMQWKRCVFFPQDSFSTPRALPPITYSLISHPLPQIPHKFSLLFSSEPSLGSASSLQGLLGWLTLTLLLRRQLNGNCSLVENSLQNKPIRGSFLFTWRLRMPSFEEGDCVSQNSVVARDRNRTCTDLKREMYPEYKGALEVVRTVFLKVTRIHSISSHTSFWMLPLFSQTNSYMAGNMAASSDSCSCCLPDSLWLTRQKILEKDLIGLVWVRCPTLDQSALSMRPESYQAESLSLVLRSVPKWENWKPCSHFTHLPEKFQPLHCWRYTIWWVSTSTNPCV